MGSGAQDKADDDDCHCRSRAAAYWGVCPACDWQGFMIVVQMFLVSWNFNIERMWKWTTYSQPWSISKDTTHNIRIHMLLYWLHNIHYTKKAPVQSPQHLTLRKTDVQTFANKFFYAHCISSLSRDITDPFMLLHPQKVTTYISVYLCMNIHALFMHICVSSELLPATEPQSQRANPLLTFHFSLALALLSVSLLFCTTYEQCFP